MSIFFPRINARDFTILALAGEEFEGTFLSNALLRCRKEEAPAILDTQEDTMKVKRKKIEMTRMIEGCVDLESDESPTRRILLPATTIAIRHDDEDGVWWVRESARKHLHEVSHYRLVFAIEGEWHEIEWRNWKRDSSTSWHSAIACAAHEPLDTTLAFVPPGHEREWTEIWIDIQRDLAAMEG